MRNVGIGPELESEKDHDHGLVIVGTITDPYGNIFIVGVCKVSGCDAWGTKELKHGKKI